MEEYLKKVDLLLHKMNSLRQEKGKHYPLKRLTEEMLKVLNERMAEEEDPDIRKEIFYAWDALDHTLHKEVEYVGYHQDKMSAKNAAKKREQEYYVALDNAIGQIWQDVSGLFHVSRSGIDKS